MRFLISKQLQTKLERFFPEESFYQDVEYLLNLSALEFKQLKFLIVEDTSLESLHILNTFQDKNPLLKIILYYSQDQLSLANLLQYPVSLPFMKSQNFQKFIDFLMILKDRTTKNDNLNNLYKHGFYLDVQQRLVSRDFKQIRLSETEFKLLHTLLVRTGRVVSKTTLLDEVWNYSMFSNSKTLEVHISRLRKTLKKHFNLSPIQTIYKTGYLFEIK